jgi:hypothetical protein
VKIKTQPEPVNIRAVQDNLGSNVCKLLFLIHAMGGCDKTSAVYGMGKANVFKSMKSYRERSSFSQIMCDVNANQAKVASSSLKFIFFNCTAASPRTIWHNYATRHIAVSTSTSRPQPQKLPPSERSAYFHPLKVHFQVVVWHSLGTTNLEPLLWGWMKRNNALEPVMTDEPPAPNDILSFVRRKCKTSCMSMLCSCRRNKLKALSHRARARTSTYVHARHARART